jgi:hypothetical protein
MSFVPQPNLRPQLVVTSIFPTVQQDITRVQWGHPCQKFRKISSQHSNECPTVQRYIRLNDRFFVFFFSPQILPTMPQPLKIERRDKKYRQSNSKEKSLRHQNFNSIAQTFVLGQNWQNNRNLSLFVL